MISFSSLQEFMSLTFIQGKLRASAPYFILYFDSRHVAWIFHQVLPKLLYPSIYIKLMVALAPTISQANPLLSLIFTSALSVSSFDVVIVAPPLDLVMYLPIHYLMSDHAMTPRDLLGPLSVVEMFS
ncbi:hypothetical protein GW17_00007306 [Ensete ventricosum]|nr:hypothetical protein GW17_00007306 [Ensete ventricosum]